MAKKRTGRKRGGRNRGYFFRKGRGWYATEPAALASLPLFDDHSMTLYVEEVRRHLGVRMGQRND